MMAGVLLLVSSVRGHGHRPPLHPAPGRRRLHQRHRDHHREHAGQGSSRPHGSGDAASTSMGRFAAIATSLSTIIAGRDDPGRCSRWPCSSRSRVRWKERVPGAILALRGRHADRRGVRPAGRNHRLALPRHPERPARPARSPQFRPGLILPLLTPAFTVAMLGGIESLMSAVGRRSAERRSAQPERRARRAGRREHRHPVLRRPAGDRRHRRAPRPTFAPARTRRSRASSTRSRCCSCVLASRRSSATCRCRCWRRS